MKFPKWKHAKHHKRSFLRDEYIWHYNSEFNIKLSIIKSLKNDDIDIHVISKAYLSFYDFNQIFWKGKSLKEIQDFVLTRYLSYLNDIDFYWYKPDISGALKYYTKYYLTDKSFPIVQKGIPLFSFDYCVIYDQSNDKGQYISKWDKGLKYLRNDYLEWRVKDYNKHISRLVNYFKKNPQCLS